MTEKCERLKGLNLPT